MYGSEPIQSAKEEFGKARQFLADHGHHFPFVIGILSGQKGESVIDLFAYKGPAVSNTWKLNPRFDYAQFRGGRFIEHPQGLTFGDGLIILGKEEEQRRLSENIEQYLLRNPRFGSKDITVCL